MNRYFTIGDKHGKLAHKKVHEIPIEVVKLMVFTVEILTQMQWD